MHLSDTVNPQFVKEATRLLKHSIVQMVSEPIQFNNIDEDISDEEHDAEQTREKSSEPRKISYEMYRKIANNVIHHLQELADAGTPGLTIDQLIDWYQEENSALLSGENFEEQMALVRLTIRRLVQLDHVLEENDSTHAITVSPDYLAYE